VNIGRSKALKRAQVTAEGIAKHQRLLVPEVALQVVHNTLHLFFKGKRPKCTPRLSTGHIETPIYQALTQARGQLASSTRQVINGICEHKNDCGSVPCSAWF
jgi:hypothetical protein